MARRMMAHFATRVLLTSSSESLRGTGLNLHRSRTPAVEHGSSLRTYAAKAAKGKTSSKGMDAATVDAVTKASKETRPRSAYTLFQKESGPQIMAKHKGVSIGDRAKILAAEWKKVSEAEKASLQARVVLDTPRLPAKMPRSAYNLWMKQTGPALLSMHGASFKNVGERARYLASEWKKVSSEEKTRLASELEKIKPVREKPVKKKASTGYTMYIAENFSSQKKPGMESKAVMKAVAEAWKGLSASEKEKYARKAAAGK